MRAFYFVGLRGDSSTAYLRRRVCCGAARGWGGAAAGGLNYVAGRGGGAGDITLAMYIQVPLRTRAFDSNSREFSGLLDGLTVFHVSVG